MALTLAEFATFKKLMALTTSPNDAEALSALRRANAVISKHGVTWPQVLDRVIKVEVAVESGEDDDMEALFEAALAQARGSFRDTLESIHEQWERTKTLSPRQREVVRKAARER